MNQGHDELARRPARRRLQHGGPLAAKQQRLVMSSFVGAAIVASFRAISAFQPRPWSFLPKPSFRQQSRRQLTRWSATKEDVSLPVPPPLSPIMQQIVPSQTVEIFSKVKAMQADGLNVTSLCVGEPDFMPSATVIDAIVQAARAGDTKYTAVTGTLELRTAICADLHRRKHVTYQPNQIVVSNGAKQAVYQALLATVGAPGDVVLVPAPYWPSYPEMVRLVGGTPVIVATTAASGYVLTPEQLRQTLQENVHTRALILCNPSNPTGSVYDRAQLQALVAVLHDFPHVWVVADEIYERLTYHVEHVALASLLWDRTITINGFSKSHAMTGLRLGYLAAPLPVAAAVTTLQGQLTSCASSISQAAGVAALQYVSDDELARNANVMRHKRDYVLSALADMPHVHVPPVPPRGAFYVLPNVSYYCGNNDTQLCLDLLETQQLALVPGTSFGAPGTVRISYATSMDELHTAMTKLRAFFLLAAKAKAAKAARPARLP